LIEIDFVPGNRGIFLERRLAFLAEGVDGRVAIFESAARSVGDDGGPSFVGLAKSDRVGMTRATIAAESLVGFFRDVRAAHDHRHADGANGVSDAIGFGDHASHSADAHEADFLFADKIGDGGFVHALRVAIDEDYFVTGRSERLQEEHPEMRHEIAGDTVVGVVEQDAHGYLPMPSSYCEREPLLCWEQEEQRCEESLKNVRDGQQTVTDGITLCTVAVEKVRNRTNRVA